MGEAVFPGQREQHQIMGQTVFSSHQGSAVIYKCLYKCDVLKPLGLSIAYMGTDEPLVPHGPTSCGAASNSIIDQLQYVRFVQSVAAVGPQAGRGGNT